MLGRRLRSRIPLLITLSVLLVLGFVYILALPQYQASQSNLISANDLYIPRLIDVIILAWCFWFGSSVGSFLNVVAWRMPRGQSVNGRSYCPRCRGRLKARDNFPVFGWLILGGRCRNCQLPISKRYPIVELVVGLSLVIVAMGQLYRFSLPFQSVHNHGGPLWAPRVDSQILTTLVFHCYAVTISWAFALVRYDRNRLPGRLVFWGILPLVAAMLCFPSLMVVTWRMLGDRTTVSPMTLSPVIDAIVRILTSFAAAALLGRSLGRGLFPAADPKLDPLGKSTFGLIDLVVILSIPTLILGWHSAIAVVALASIVAVLLRRTLLTETNMMGVFSVAIPIVLTLHLLLWSRLYHWPAWPSPESSPTLILGWAAFALVSPLWLREPRSQSPAYESLPVDPNDQADDDAPDEEPAESVEPPTETLPETPPPSQ